MEFFASEIEYVNRYRCNAIQFHFFFFKTLLVFWWTGDKFESIERTKSETEFIYQSHLQNR